MTEAEALEIFNQPVAPSADTPVMEVPEGSTAAATEMPDKFAFKTEQPTPTSSAPMDDNEALEQTRTLMDMRNTVQSMGIALYADGSIRTHDQYEYEDWQIDLLVKAWAPVVRDSGLRVSPFVKILYTEAITATPLVGLAMKNRKQRLEIEELKAENERLRQKNPTANVQASSGTASQRRDTQKHWKVDKNGYFMYTIANGYILDNNRKEKPNVKEYYDMLCKHNGKDYIDTVYKINE